MVSVRPLFVILPWTTLCTPTGCWSRSKFSGAFAGPTRAFAVPCEPAFEPDGHADGPLAARSSRLHFLKPLPENFRPDGSSTWMVLTVVPGRLTFVPKVS